MVLDIQHSETTPAPASTELYSEVELSILAAQTALLEMQDPIGYWEVPLEADTTLVSDYVMLVHYLGEVDEAKELKAVTRLRRQQLEDGGWSIYPGGPSELNATVKAALALQLAGVSDDDSAAVAATRCIQRLGGIEGTKTYTRFYLALFGLIPWKWVPAILPEVMFLPTSFYFNIYEISSWSRAILVPMSIIWSKKPYKRPPTGVDVTDWWVSHTPDGRPPDRGHVFSWRRFFHSINSLLQTSEGLYSPFTRREALRRAKRWMVERVENSEGLAAIYPAMLNSIIALDALGYGRKHPVFQHAMKTYMDLLIEKDDEIVFMPCKSPVWNTAIATAALSRSGLAPDHPQLIKATDWLLEQEVRAKGDWQIKNPYGPASGWCFEFGNPYYPDTDDTAMVLMAIDSVIHPDEFRCRESLDRGLEWLLSMQNSDGGWGAFDVENCKSVLNHIPFADHNALLDPSTADLTGRILECLGQLGYDGDCSEVRRAIDFLVREQEADGAWYGRWGVNYIYGTWQAIVGLRAIGEPVENEAIQRGGTWLLEHQNPDGGWGETIQSYDDASLRGSGPSTPSQTAWALMGAAAAGHSQHPAVLRGAEYLARTQRPDGTWNEEYFTGTGFPRVFYLGYPMYRDYFPLMALGRLRVAWQANES